MPLEIADLVQDKAHHELVEEDYADKGQVDQENGGLILTVVGVIGGGFGGGGRRGKESSLGCCEGLLNEF